VLIGLMVWYRVGVSAALLTLPLVVVVHLVFTAGIALLLAMANLFYRDVKYLFEVVITVWMFATSVLYPVDRVAGWAGTILRLNPMTPIIDAYRSVLLRGDVPPLMPITVTAAVAVALLASVWLVFHRSEFQFAEYI